MSINGTRHTLSQVTPADAFAPAEVVAEKIDNQEIPKEAEPMPRFTRSMRRMITGKRSYKSGLGRKLNPYKVAKRRGYGFRKTLAYIARFNLRYGSNFSTIKPSNT